MRGRRWNSRAPTCSEYKLADGTDLVVRPSGTEPKVKVYILSQGESHAQCGEKISKYSAWAETLQR